MSPTLRKAHLLAHFRAIGDCADSISWWEPGVLVGDGVSCWELVTAGDGQGQEVAG